MSSRSHERRTERATAEEVAEVERQLWEFAKHIDPPSVPEAKLRPGAFLWRIHRTWHDLGRGTGGLASRSFRALRDELLDRDPPVRNLQPKLYGNTPLSQAEAEQLIGVMLETWHLERNKSGKWQAKPLFQANIDKHAESQDLEAIRENLLHTLFKGDDHLLLEEPVGVPPEIFLKERGRESLALILPTKAETLAHLSPSNAYGGFSSGLEQFFDAAAARLVEGNEAPLLIWVLRLGVIRDNSEFHQAFHAIAMYSASLTNWYLRLSRKRGTDRKNAEIYWKMIVSRSAFVIHGLSTWNNHETEKGNLQSIELDDELADLDPNFLLPNPLPIVLSNHRQVRRHTGHKFGLNVSVEKTRSEEASSGITLSYWLTPDEPTNDIGQTAETTGLPVFNAELSPGQDFDLAYFSVFRAVSYRLGFSTDEDGWKDLCTLDAMGWNVLTIEELQNCLLISDELRQF